MTRPSARLRRGVGHSTPPRLWRKVVRGPPRACYPPPATVGAVAAQEASFAEAKAIGCGRQRALAPDSERFGWSGRLISATEPRSAAWFYTPARSRSGTSWGYSLLAAGNGRSRAVSPTVAGEIVPCFARLLREVLFAQPSQFLIGGSFGYGLPSVFRTLGMLRRPSMTRRIVIPPSRSCDRYKTSHGAMM